MEEPKDYVFWKTGKRMNRSGITLNLTSLEKMVNNGGNKRWEGLFDSYIKYQTKDYHFSCQTAYCTY